MKTSHLSHISVLYNKPSARFTRHNEHKAAEEDTEHSAVEVADALVEKGMHPTLVPVTEHTIEQTISSLTRDIVFNLIEWTGVDVPYAERIYDLMDAKNVCYTGATKASYFLSCDKTVSKKKLDTLHLPTASWQLFVTGNEAIRDDLQYPVIVKVSNEHSSVGIEKDSVVLNACDLVAVVKRRIAVYRQPVFAEAFLSGREFQVTLLETDDGLRVLPPAEIMYTKDTDVPLLTYNSRWDEDHREYSNSRVALAALDPSLEEAIMLMSMQAFTNMGFRDYARFDIRCDRENHPYFLELNSNPGLGDDQEYGMTVSYKAAGMTFADFVFQIVRSTQKRYITG